MMLKLKTIKKIIGHLLDRSHLSESGKVPKLIISGCLGLLLLIVLPVFVVLILLAIYLIDIITKKADLTAVSDWVKNQFNNLIPTTEVGQWIKSLGDFVTSFGGTL
jgi:hypothetical protein